MPLVMEGWYFIKISSVDSGDRLSLGPGSETYTVGNVQTRD